MVTALRSDKSETKDCTLSSVTTRASSTPELQYAGSLFFLKLFSIFSTVLDESYRLQNYFLTASIMISFHIHESKPSQVSMFL